MNIQEIENCPTCGFKTKAFRTIKSNDAKIESDKPVNSSSSSEEKPKPKKFWNNEPWWVLKKRQKTAKNQNSILEKKMDSLTV